MKIIKVFGYLLVILGLISVLYFSLNKPKDMLTRVGELVDLPDEVPSIMTVTDVSKLKTQNFFKRAENGDTVFVFYNAKKAILYRSKDNKVLEMAKVEDVQLENSSSATVELVEKKLKVIEEPISMAIFNGTEITGLAGVYEKKINDSFPQVTVVTKENAVRSDFLTTSVVDVSGENEKLVNDIVGSMGGVVIELGDDDVKPDVDIMVIVGRDFE